MTSLAVVSFVKHHFRMDLFMTLALKQSVFISAQMLRFDKYFKAIQQKRGSSHLGNMSTVVFTKKVL